MGDAARLKVQPLNRGLAPGGDQKMRAGQHKPVGQHRLDPFGHAAQADHALTFDDLDPFGAQGGQNHRRAIRIIAAKRAGGLDHRHAAAQPLMRLRHFHPDGATTQNQQMVRAVSQGKDRLIGQIGQILDARNRRDRGMRAGGNHEPPRADQGLARLHLTRGGEARPIAQDGDAQPFEPLLAVMWGDAGDDARDVVFHGGKVDCGLYRRNAEGRAAAHGLRRLARREKRF